ncbi:MAG: 50S ribosomal protein L13 [Candidatus Moranbacteria bacterium]|nr:50S ribosomal protein L13 [Candidatus Moranbacteria bacterium]
MTTNQRKIHLFNANGKILGRLAVEVAKLLSGRSKVDYTPHIDAGDHVVILNTDKISVTGRKRFQKIYYSHTGYPGGVREKSFDKRAKEDSRKIFYDAVYGMLPKNKLRARMLTRLHLYKDDTHPHQVDVNHE